MKVGLVLEGGAMRGLYTAGVLDTFMENGIKVDGIIGVSAGALFGVNYVSNQKGRTLRYNQKYLNDKRYMSFYSLLTTGNLVNKKFAFYDIPLKYDKFDEVAFENSGIDFYATVTNVKTGKPEYIKITNAIEQTEVFRATAAMPFVSKIVDIGENKYLDGGISDSIPIDKCRNLGYDKIIVVLTRPKSYRKKKINGLLPKTRYNKYPNLVKCIQNRYKVYNECLEKIEELEANGEIFVIRPSRLVNISRIEKNVEKLEEMYNLGEEDCKSKLDMLKAYLK